MATAYIEIEITSPHHSNPLAKALKEIKVKFPDFPELCSNRSWWHKPPVNARSVISRIFAKYRLVGKISVEYHDGVSPWNEPPKPRWTGFGG